MVFPLRIAGAGQLFSLFFSAGQANRHTAAAKFARAVGHICICTERDARIESTVDHADCIDAIDVGARPDTAPAQNALVEVNLDEWVRIGDWVLVVQSRGQLWDDAIFINQILQQTIAGGVAGHAVKGMVG